MDCQPRLELQRDAKHLNSNAPTEWIESNPASDPMPFAVKTSLEPSSSTLQRDCQIQQDLMQVILNGDNIHDTLAVMAQVIGEAFSADYCSLISQQGDRGIAQSTCWQPASVPPLASSPNDLLSLLGHLLIASNSETNSQSNSQTNSEPPLELGEPLAVADLRATVQKKYTPSSSKAEKKVAIALPKPLPPVRAILAMNTQFQGQVNGMIVVMRSRPYEWKESDVQLLKSLSSQVAIAISQTQLEQQVQQQIRYQNLINQLTTAIRNTWEIDRIFQLAAEGTASALQVSRGMIFLLKYSDPLHRNRRNRSIPKAKATVTAEWLDSVSPSAPVSPPVEVSEPNTSTFWASDCLLCRQILSGELEPVIVPARSVPNPTPEQTPKEGIAPSDTAPVFHLDRLPALMLAPLENQGTVLGCLVLQHHQLRSWSFEDIAFVKLVAAQLSTAIIQTRTLQQIQAVVKERTAQLQRSLEVQAKLYEKTRQQVEQLRRLNEEREEFLSTVSHELRTPLTSMTLAIRMLRQAELSPERRSKYLDILEQQCIQETQLINDLLALRKLETSSTNAQLQKLDIRYLLRDLAQSVEESFAERGLTLELDLPSKPLTLYTETDSLSRILTELLVNAKKYSEAGSSILLQVTHEPSLADSKIVLALKNTGSGILPEELPHIFDKFRRGQGVTKQAIQGTGLGLALVKGLVEHLGGAIAASSQPIESDSSWQTCFTITLPQCPEGVIRAIS